MITPEFIDNKNGFTIKNGHGAEVTVEFLPFQVKVHRGESVFYNRTFGYHEYRLIYNYCVSNLMLDGDGVHIKCPASEKAHKAYCDKFHNGNDKSFFLIGGFEKWYKRIVGQIINAGFVERWHLYKEKCADQLGLQVNKRITSVLGFARFRPDVKNVIEDLEKYPYYTKDFFKYNAAVYIADNARFFSSGVSVRSGLTSDNMLDKSVDLDHWMDIYRAKIGTKSYRKTLMTLPRSLSASVISRLVTIKKFLKSHLKTKSEITFNSHFELEIQEQHTWDSKTLKKVAKFLRNEGYDFKMNSTNHIMNMKRFIFDCPNPHKDLMIWARNSVEWHATQHLTSNGRFSAEKALAKPEWNIDHEQISLLETVGDLIKESQTMHHCVQSYDNRCVSGQSFIYHVEKDKKNRATIEVNNLGEIIQAQGPCNRQNDACKWGRSQINRQIKKWKKEKQSC